MFGIETTLVKGYTPLAIVVSGIGTMLLQWQKHVQNLQSDSSTDARDI